MKTDEEDTEKLKPCSHIILACLSDLGAAGGGGGRGGGSCQGMRGREGRQCGANKMLHLLLAFSAQTRDSYRLSFPGPDVA